MVDVSRRCVVLTDHEQRARSDIEQSYGDEVDRMDQEAREGEGMSAVAVGGVCIALMFALVGAPAAGLVLVVATTLGWLLWRYRRQVGAACEAAYLPMAGGWKVPWPGTEATSDESPDPPRRTPERDSPS